MPIVLYPADEGQKAQTAVQQFLSSFLAVLTHAWLFMISMYSHNAVVQDAAAPL